MIKRPVVLQHRLDLFQTKCNQRMTELMTCLTEYVNELAYQLYEDLHLGGPPDGSVVSGTRKPDELTNGDDHKSTQQPQPTGDDDNKDGDPVFDVNKAASKSLYSSDDDAKDDDKDYDYFGDNDVVLLISDDDEQQLHTVADRRYQKEFMRHIARVDTAPDAAAGCNAAVTEVMADTDSDDYFRTFEEEAAEASAGGGRSSRSKKITDPFFEAIKKKPKKNRIRKRAGSDTPRSADQQPRPMFSCDLCSFTGVSKMTVVKHRRATHKVSTSVEKQFECDICAKRVCTKLAMEAHMRTHTGERPFICDVCCDSFKFFGSLLRHKRGHDAVREFKCQQCDKAYFQQQDLKVHLQMHTGVRPQTCPVCGRGFWKRFHVLHHLQKEHGVVDAAEAARIYPPKVPQRVYVSRREMMARKGQPVQSVTGPGMEVDG